MAKKIIKDAKKKEKVKKAHCSCGVTFSYESNDIEYDREGHYVTCPSCGKFIATN